MSNLTLSSRGLNIFFEKAPELLDKYLDKRKEVEARFLITMTEIISINCYENIPFNRTMQSRLAGCSTELDSIAKLSKFPILLITC